MKNKSRILTFLKNKFIFLLIILFFLYMLLNDYLKGKPIDFLEIGIYILVSIFFIWGYSTELGGIIGKKGNKPDKEEDY